MWPTDDERKEKFRARGSVATNWLASIKVVNVCVLDAGMRRLSALVTQPVASWVIRTCLILIKAFIIIIIISSSSGGGCGCGMVVGTLVIVHVQGRTHVLYSVDDSNRFLMSTFVHSGRWSSENGTWERKSTRRTSDRGNRDLDPKKQVEKTASRTAWFPTRSLFSRIFLREIPACSVGYRRTDVGETCRGRRSSEKRVPAITGYENGARVLRVGRRSG